MICIDPNSPMDEAFQAAMDILLGAFGCFDQDVRDCRCCYVYRGVGQYDVQHAVIAKLLGASDLLTFDKAFSTLANHADFAGKISFTVR